MKFLESQRQQAQENKMMPGSRTDQDGPERVPHQQSQDIKSKRKSDDADRITALAKQLNVDLTTLKGTGVNGEITMQDVRAEAVRITKSLPISGPSFKD